MTYADDVVAMVLQAYRAAVHAKDVDAFVALYADDVRVFDLWGQWQYDGLDAWRGMASAWFGSLADERVVVDFAEVRAVATTELAVGHAFVSYAAVDAHGTTLRSLTNRISVTLRRHGDDWKIAHEHSSAPLDFATAKAIFQR